jgi:hypothetical protein
MRALAVTLLIVSLGFCCELSHALQSGDTPYTADGLYNLANAYARAGKPGLAVLNYQRAALLAPEDSDITANLDYVRASAHLPAEDRGRIEHIVLAAPPTWVAWLGVLGVALIGSGLLAQGRLQRARWMPAVSAAVGLVLLAFTVSQAALLWPRMHAAVVLVDKTPARVSPVPMSDMAFVLPEAETVTMTAQHEDFALIRDRHGRSGWVARARLGAVLP